jgi:hypothetical protein
MTGNINTEVSNMSNLQEEPVWVDSIYQLTTETPVLGKQEDIPGNGPANLQAEQLANRTQYLKVGLDTLQSGEQPYSSESAANTALSEGKSLKVVLYQFDHQIHSTGLKSLRMYRANLLQRGKTG